MKYFKYIIVVFLVYFCSLLHANAFVHLCNYTGLVDFRMEYGNPITQYSNLLLTIEGSDYKASFKTTQAYFPLETVYDGENLDYELHDQLWHFNSSLTRATSEMGSKNFWGQTITYEVVWEDDSQRSDFLQKGICPPIITYGDDDTKFALTPIFKIGPTIPEKSYYNEKNKYDSNPTGYKYSSSDYMVFFLNKESESDTNYYPSFVRGDGKKYAAVSLFSQDIRNYVEELSTTCVTDVDKITYLTDLYNYKVEGFEYNISQTEKGYLARLYANNGYDEYASNIRTIYGPNSECYKNNPSMSEAYDALVNAASSFSVDSGTSIVDVNDCETILGKGSFASYLNMVFRFVQFLAPTIVIILTVVEYIKVAALSDSELLKKTNSRTVIRLVMALALFLIPVILKFILNIFGFYGDCLDSIL